MIGYIFPFSLFESSYWQQNQRHVDQALDDLPLIPQFRYRSTISWYTASNGWRSFIATFIVAGASACSAPSADEVLIEVAPVVLSAERNGITGAGWAFASGTGDTARITLHYPTHPDDFGKSTGTCTALSEDGGQTWTEGQQNWPIDGMVDLWQDQLRDGRFVALGIHWLPDPRRRRDITAAEVPEDAWKIAFSANGKDWSVENSVIDCPDKYGVVARPLPRFLEASNGTLIMPAYAWGNTGNRSLLLQSTNGGRRWSVRSVITSAEEMDEAGATVTAPWLETTVSPTADGSWLAIIRTGSNENAGLMMVRSQDEGLTWGPVVKVMAGPDSQPVTGKLPSLLRMPEGPLVLLTAHSKRGCFLYLSADGTGREWCEGKVVTTVTESNTSMCVLDHERLLVFTPSSRRISCWQVTLRTKPFTEISCVY